MHARLAQTRQVRGLVEPAREHAKRPVARRAHDVRARLGREGGERQLAHGAPSSVGDRYASASDRCSAPTADSDCERGDRLGHAPRTRPAAPRERQPFDRAVEQLGRLLRPGRARHVQPLARRSHAMPHRIGGLARRSGQLDRARPRHRDDEVEAVEERARQLVPERGQSLRRALAVGRRIAAGAARTEVHRRDELEARREHRPPADARDADDAVLERLPQRLERGPLELGELVEDEHAAMSEADLAGFGPGPPPTSAATDAL